jgi:hypothetical protein
MEWGTKMGDLNSLSPATVLVISLVFINTLISSGTLWKVIDFAKDYGGLKQQVKTHDEEIKRLRNLKP